MLGVYGYQEGAHIRQIGFISLDMACVAAPEEGSGVVEVVPEKQVEEEEEGEGGGAGLIVIICVGLGVIVLAIVAIAVLVAKTRVAKKE